MIARCDNCKNTVAIYNVGVIIYGDYDEINVCAGCWRKLDREFGRRVKINNKIWHIENYTRKKGGHIK